MYGLGADASAILGVHRTDERGMCAGCQTLWSLLVPFPCRQAEWAGAVTARVATLAVLGPPVWLPDRRSQLAAVSVEPSLIDDRGA